MVRLEPNVFKDDKNVYQIVSRINELLGVLENMISKPRLYGENQKDWINRLIINNIDYGIHLASGSKRFLLRDWKRENKF